MKALLLSVGLGLIAALQAWAFPTFEEDKVSETWYLKATASDQKTPVRKLGDMSVSPMTIKTLEGATCKSRSLSSTETYGQTALLKELTFSRILGRCQDMSIYLERTDQPGKYTAYGNKMVTYIIKSQVDGHYVFYSEGELHGHQFRMAELVGRDPNINQQALEDFENAVRRGGLNTENIFIPRQRDTCSPGRD